MDGQTDRQMYRFAISISGISMLTRDKNSGKSYKNMQASYEAV